jgi:threonine dehydratase
MLDVSLLDVIKAQAKIKDQINPTPLLSSPALSEKAGADVWLKVEALQKTGSFKLRGAFTKLFSLSPREREKGVITASAGNHAQGVAYASAHLHISALIVVPKNAPETKKAGIQRFGAQLVEFGDNYDEAEAHAFELAETTGRTFVHAFEDEQIIAGQGTVGLEILLEQPDFDTLVVPAGGGGLICGVAVAAKAINPDIRVMGIQSHASPPWYYSFREKKIADVTYFDSLADGLHGGISQGNLDLALQVVDDFILVEEAEIAHAMYWLAKEHHFMIEGSGAVGVAALLNGHLNLAGQKVCTILSGSNVDATKLGSIIQKHT